MRSEAYLSDDRIFRYWLLRVWSEALPLYAVIGANPSTADESADDPTIRKIVGFGQRLGFGGVLMLNLGAFRATRPSEWRSAPDPFGPGNSIAFLQSYLKKFSPEIVVAAWGKPCLSLQVGQHRARAIIQSIRGMKCWGQNPGGSPRHPLMLSYSTPLDPYN